MVARRFVRALYSRASDSRVLRRPLGAIRANPSVRAFARRRIRVLLARGTTWANVDGALRLLGEDPDQAVVFGPWQGDGTTELLYWAPFVRWASEHFALDPGRVAVVAREGAEHWYGEACGVRATTIDAARSALPGAAVFPAEPVMTLVQQYREGSAPLRPLLKRTRHVLLQPPDDPAAEDRSENYVAAALAPSPAFPDSARNRQVAADLLETVAAARPVVSVEDTRTLLGQHALVAGAGGLVAAYSGLALLGALSGIPVIALHSQDGDVPEPDFDLALRVVSELGGFLTILDIDAVGSLRSALGRVEVRREGQLQ